MVSVEPAELLADAEALHRHVHLHAPGLEHGGKELAVAVPGQDGGVLGRPQARDGLGLDYVAEEYQKLCSVSEFGRGCRSGLVWLPPSFRELINEKVLRKDEV